MPRPLFVDCDPGIDDAIALMTVLADPDVELLGVSTVAGNLPVETTTRNARRLLDFMGRPDVPVASGAARPLAGELHVAPEVHGADGLGGVELPEPRGPILPRGAAFLAERVMASPAPVVLLATGPLTNVALALHLEPRLPERLERIVVMGGAVRGGNVTPVAEFNAYVDPEAAAVVYGSGIPTVMVGLDVTEQVLVRRPDLARLAALGSPVAVAAARMLEFYVRFHERTRGQDASPVHDAVAALEALHPGTLEIVHVPVAVETAGHLTRGATVVDLRAADPACPTAVAVGVDAEAACREILAAVAAAGKGGRSPRDASDRAEGGER